MKLKEILEEIEKGPGEVDWESFQYDKIRSRVVGSVCLTVVLVLLVFGLHKLNLWLYFDYILDRERRNEIGLMARSGSLGCSYYSYLREKRSYLDEIREAQTRVQLRHAKNKYEAFRMLMEPYWEDPKWRKQQIEKCHRMGYATNGEWKEIQKGTAEAYWKKLEKELLDLDKNPGPWLSWD